MNDKFRMRNAVAADEAAINSLCVAAYEEFAGVIGKDNWRRMRETLARSFELINHGELLVAEDATEILGVVLYVPANHFEVIDGSVPPGCALLRTLAVLPGARGRGIGRALVQECIRRACADGAPALALTTTEMMKTAQPMYERMGFCKEKELNERFGQKETLYVLRL